jgi:heme o synthase
MKADPGVNSIPRSSILWAGAADYLELTKPGLTSLVVFTTFAGFCIGTQGSIPFGLLFHTLFGTALMAGGAATFNMHAERGVDALMKRTALRPLAAGRLKSKPALLFAFGISTAGFVCLHVFVNHLASLLSAIIFAAYLFLYTPLKAKTWLCTFAGAIPGALPIAVGWAGANAALSSGAWVLFSIVFFWQFPHFYSISWMHREDYARAGLHVLSVVDRSGHRTARHVVLVIAILIFCSLLPAFTGLAVPAYLIGAIVLGSAFLAYAIHFARRRNYLSARRLFVASALYLPFLLMLLLLARLSTNH